MNNINKFDNIAILKCKEKDLKHNISVLCENCVETIIGIPTIFSNGDYFYFALRNIEIVKSLDVRGEFI